MHQNSLLAYNQITNLSERHQKILRIYQNSPVPLTARDVLRLFGGYDMNQVRPRCSELIDMGLLREVADTKDRITGKSVRMVTVNTENNGQMRLF